MENELQPQDTQPFYLSVGQQAVARLFFTLPESEGFVIAGGLALIANSASDRKTEDIDLFTNRAESVPRASHSLQKQCITRGWGVKIERDLPTFVSLTVEVFGELVIVDLAQDSPLLFAPTQSSIGPTVSIEEALGRKLCAVFGRTQARDFFDLYGLVATFSKERALELAYQIDSGFDSKVAGQMMRRVAMINEAEFPGDPRTVPAVREFFISWANELETT